MRAAISLSAVLLAACNPAEEAATETADEAETVVADSDAEGEFDQSETVTSDARPIPALDSDGLRMVIPSGATRLVGFGSSRDSVEGAIGRALGKAGTRSANGECGAGPMEFSRVDGLTLNFQDAKFVGWTLQPPSPLSTIDGISLGRTREQIAETREVSLMQDSTLGAEFSAGGIGGFFDGEGGTVSLLYAGMQCFFR